jgi:hypothetical protein
MHEFTCSAVASGYLLEWIKRLKLYVGHSNKSITLNFLLSKWILTFPAFLKDKYCKIPEKNSG